MSRTVGSWNVNSVRARLEHVLSWIDARQPDIVALQETKLVDEQFPVDAFTQIGYRALVNGQKTYNGVAVLSRETLSPEDIVVDLPNLADEQRRLLAASYGTLRIINVYVPNGSEVGSQKYEYKLRWLDRLIEFIEGQLAQYPQLVLLGDFNIAPEDRDVHNPDLWQGGVLVSEPERERFRRLMELGLKDSFRLFDDAAGQYTWWDYRAGAFRRNLGLRIDHILVSETLKPHCEDCRIDIEPRSWQRPSDHTPIILQLDK
jgi:exodeoxyribonuclease-3